MAVHGGMYIDSDMLMIRDMWPLAVGSENWVYWRGLNPEWLTPEWVLVLVLVVLMVVLVVLAVVS